ncbi:MAG: MBL fold metallo-hydrolase [Candidatus Eisenbacteria bacterium]|uniref:MBL fold metallo-hydrolase n=1 Tax=Eiseniibacteriota bacterium TaxID=2212470 RepID=A0A538U121_UNCEI|nr:MAG: MBL fold metallo-hydrolase [Candidatus Eisenbacteria bacterium]
MRRGRLVLAMIAAALLGEAAAAQQRNVAQVEIKTTPLGEGVSMMEGAGGNLGVSVGPDGVLLIDDELAPLSDKIKAAIAKLSDRPVKILFNTHYHGDHVGGNENFGNAGATIVAHDNVWARMSQADPLRSLPPYPGPALPLISFRDRITFHVNGDTLQVIHVPPAHTDGDCFLLFEKANVLHTGDLFFNGRYPFIDVPSGGSVDGMVAADEKILALANDRTRIIPGHGPLGDKASLQGFHDMMVQVRDRIRPLVAAGKTKDEIVAAKPTADFDETWGKGGAMPERFVGAIVDGWKK